MYVLFYHARRRPRSKLTGNNVECNCHVIVLYVYIHGDEYDSIIRAEAASFEELRREVRRMPGTARAVAVVEDGSVYTYVLYIYIYIYICTYVYVY